MDLEGVTAKWRHGVYQVGGATTSWLKLKNPRYSQMEGRERTVRRSSRRSTEAVGLFSRRLWLV
jgi:ATP-dependent DNA ligase